MATKDILASITLTIIFILFISDMFNEEDSQVISKESIINDIYNDINNIQVKLKQI